jgi:hypothetical protein
MSPAGTAEGCPGLRRSPFSAVPSGLGRPFKSNPGLASWAKFSRTCGTECAVIARGRTGFGNGVLTHVCVRHGWSQGLKQAAENAGFERKQPSAAKAEFITQSYIRPKGRTLQRKRVFPQPVKPCPYRSLDFTTLRLKEELRIQETIVNRFPLKFGKVYAILQGRYTFR